MTLSIEADEAEVVRGVHLSVSMRLKELGWLLPIAVPVLLVAVAWSIQGDGNWLVDEAYTATESRLPFPDLLQVFWRRELNGSLHTLLMWLMFHLTGATTPQAYRIPSVLFYLGACAAMARMLWYRTGPAASWVGVAVLASSAVLLRQSVNGRTYPLTVLLTVGTLWLALRLVEQRSVGRAIAWGVLAGACLYAHFFTAPVIGVEAIWLTAHLRLTRAWWAAMLPGAFVAVPVMGFFLAGGGDAGQLPATPQENWHDLVAGVLALLLEGADGDRLVQAAAVAGVVSLGVLAWRGPHGSLARLAAPSVLAVVALGALATRVYPGIFNASHLITAVPALALLCAVGVHAASRKAAVFVVLVLAAALIADGQRLTLLYQQDRSLRDGWQAVADYIAERSTAGDQVSSMVPYEGLTAGYYARQRGLTFVPAAPEDANALLRQSSYDDYQCLPNPGPGHSLWVISTQSPRLKEHLPAAANCGGLRVLTEVQISFVTLVRLRSE